MKTLKNITVGLVNGKWNFVNKSKGMELGKGNMRPGQNYKMRNDSLIKAEEPKDFSVVFQNDLSPEKHCQYYKRFIS